MGDNHRSEKKSKTTYVVGSIVLTAAAFVVVSKVMDWGASNLYNQKVKQKPKDEDDWGPEIVKTDSLKKEKENAELQYRITLHLDTSLPDTQEYYE